MQTHTPSPIFRTLSFLLMFLVLIPLCVAMISAMQGVTYHIYMGSNIFLGFLAIVLPQFAIWGIAVVIHESGHFLAARLQGMTVTEVKIGWLVISMRRGGFRFSLRRMQGLGGWVKALAGSASVRREMIVFVLGGPAANLLLGLACYEVSLWCFMHGAVLTAGCLFTMALANLFMGLANLLPIGRRMPSDGSRLFHWIFKGSRDQAQLALMRLTGASAKGLRARDIPLDDIRLLSGSAKPVQAFSGGWFDMRAAMDRSDNASALRVFEEYGDRYAALPQKDRDSVDPVWKLFLSEHAYLQALESGLAFDARQELGAPGRETIPGFMRLRLEAAACLAEGAPGQARELLEHARREVEDSYDTGTRSEENQLLDVLESRLAT